MINYYGTIYHIGGTGYHYVGKVKYCERTENQKNRTRTVKGHC